MKLLCHFCSNILALTFGELIFPLEEEMDNNEIYN